MQTLDDRQRVVVKTFGREELSKMSVDDLVKLIGEAGPGAKFHGTGIVRKANGKIRYDDNSRKGSYHEAQGDL